MDRTKKEEKPVFEIEDRGFTCRAWYLEDTPESKGDALVEISFGGTVLRTFEWPAYKIWNIAAHFSDIVDGELSKTDQERGYRMAAWNGISGAVLYDPSTTKTEEKHP